MASANNEKPIYTQIKGQLSDAKGKPINPTDLGQLLNQISFVNGTVIRSSVPTKLSLTVLIKESNQGGLRTIGRLIHQKLADAFDLASVELYSCSLLPLLNGDQPDLDWKLFDELNCHQLINEPIRSGTCKEELDIIQVWSKYLRIPVSLIDLDDNLFELGGNLFVAGRIASDLYRNGYQVDLETILSTGTVRKLAAALQSPNLASIGSQVVQRVSGERKCLLSWTQRWVFIHEQLLGKGNFYYLDCSYSIPSGLDKKSVEEAINTLVSSIELLRSFVRVKGSSHYLTVASKRKLSIPVITVSSDEEAREEIDKRKEATNITTDDTFLFDAVFIDQIDLSSSSSSPISTVFTLFIHHLIIDDLSYLLFEENLFNLLDQARNGQKPLSLPVSDIQYIDYTAWVTREIQRKTEVTDKLEEYWLNRMADLPRCAIPINFDEKNPPKEAKISGKHFLISLSEEETNAARRLIRDNGTTLDILTEAVIKVLIYKYSGVGDTIVKKVLAARMHPTSYDMMGHFNNMLYSRTAIEGNPKFSEVLRSFHESYRKDFAYRAHPWINAVAQTNVEHVLPAGISIIGLPEERLIDDESLPVKVFKLDKFTQVAFELVTCIFGIHEGKLHYCLNYNEDLMLPEVISSFADSFEQFIKRAVTYSDRSLDDYFNNIEPAITINPWPQVFINDDD